MKKVDKCVMTDPYLSSLFERVEAILEGFANAEHTIISVNFIPNTTPPMAVIFHSYEEVIH